MTLALVLPVRTTVEPRAFWGPILAALHELGVQVEVVAGGVRPPRTGREGHKLLRLPSPSFPRSIVRSRAASLFCIEYGVPTLVAVMLGRITGKQTLIFQEHQGRGNLHVRLGPAERCYRHALGRLVHGFIANTDAAYIELVDVVRIDRKKVFRATLLVPPERADLGRDNVPVPEPLRRPVFLFAGRLIKSKNVLGLLVAAGVLRERGLAFEVWILGEGPERSTLEERAMELGLQDNIRFLGPRANSGIGSAYEAADVFVMPTFRDYRSVAVLEALRFGLPVIDSLCDGNANDSVEHEVTGLIFDPYEEGALSRAMERAIIDPVVFREMGQRASAAMENQTPESAAIALRNILQGLGSPQQS